MIENRKLSKSEIDEMAALLASNFIDDTGMIKLLGLKEGNTAVSKLYHWFAATLRLQQSAGQYLMLLSVDHEKAGFMLAGCNKQSPPIAALLIWCYDVLKQCGLHALKNTIRHDQKRKKRWYSGKCLIVEFVAVKHKYRGNGLSGELFNYLEQNTDCKFICLETTKQRNTGIFERLGYTKNGEMESEGVKYYYMYKQPYTY